MYLTIRQYAGVRSPEEIGRRVGAGLVPALRAMPGFRAYYAVGAEDGGGGAFSVTVFDRREVALEANEWTRAWVAGHLRDLAPEPPEVTGGEVVHAEEEAPPQGRSRDGWVVVWAFDAMGPPEWVRRGLRDIAQALGGGREPGLRRLWVLASEGQTGRGVVVAVFEGRERAMRAHEQVLAIVREKEGGVAPDPPRVTAGRTLVLATA
jgi:hypothetical protein